MLVALIASTETIEIEATAETLTAAREQVIAQVPTGFTLTDALPVMAKGGASVTVKGKARSDERDEIEAEDRAGLDAQLKPGWRLLSIRHV